MTISRYCLAIAATTISLAACAKTTSVPETATALRTGKATGVAPIMELSSLPGSTAANGVNSAGIIAGGRSGGCNSGKFPAIWLNGGEPIDLPMIAPNCSGTAIAINESGVMIGHMDQAPHFAAAIWTPRTVGGIDYDVGSMGSLPDGTSIDLRDLNNSDEAVANHNGSPGSKAYWWSRSTGFVALPTPAGATQCFAEAINDLGEIGGQCSVNGMTDAALWSSPASIPTFLPRLPTGEVAHSVVDLNESGVIVGYTYKRSKSGIVQVGLRWTRSGSTWVVEKLPDFGASGTQPWAINDAGIIVGASWVGSGKNHAFILQPGFPIQDLGALSSESWAFAVTGSAATQLTVVGVANSAGEKRAWLWHP